MMKGSATSAPNQEHTKRALVGMSRAMSIIATIKNIEENEKARPWAIAAARCVNPHSPIPFTGIDAEDGKDLVTWEGGVPKWRPVSKMCTMGCRHPECVLEQTHKGENPGEFCGSMCGIVHNNFTIQSHMPRVFEDDSPEAAAAKIFAEEDAELRRRELVTITAHDLPGQSEEVVWTANNRYNQCQFFLPFLEDGEGGRRLPHPSVGGVEGGEGVGER